jgi:TonB family protein
MKARLAILSCFLFALASTVPAQTPNASEPAQWKRYTLKDEEFSVTLPTPPRLRTNEVFVERIKKRRVDRVLAATADGVLYSICARENPKPRQSLADFVAEQTIDYKPALLVQRAIELNGVAGIELKSLDAKRPTIEQFFATNDHLYRFMAFGVSGDHAGAKQFFASIALGKNPAGTDVSALPGPAQTDAGEEIYSNKEVDVKARITKFFPPEYSEDARRHQVTGVVILKVVFSSTGEVTNVQVISGLPYGLSDKAIEAAKKTKFVPAMKNGKFVASWMQMEMNFSLY